MKSHLRIILSTLFAISLALCFAGCAETIKPSATTINPPKAQITVLYDAFGKNPALKKSWGYAALIEIGRAHV